MSGKKKAVVSIPQAEFALVGPGVELPPAVPLTSGTASVVPQPSEPVKDLAAKPVAGKRKSKSSGGNLPPGSSLGTTGAMAPEPEPEDPKLAVVLFTPEMATELAGAAAWIRRITGGLEISVVKLVRIVLANADHLTEAFLRGHVSARNPVEIKRKEEAAAFSKMLKGMAPASPKAKLRIESGSLTILGHCADRMKAGLRSPVHVRVCFEHLWREGANLVVKEWLLGLGDRIQKSLNSASEKIEKDSEQEKGL